MRKILAGLCFVAGIAQWATSKPEASKTVPEVAVVQPATTQAVVPAAAQPKAMPVAATMAFPEAHRLITLVGQGVGIGKACRLEYSALSDGFRKVVASDRYTGSQKDQLRLAYQDGEGTAAMMMRDGSGCESARQMWSRQMQTLTGAMLVAR
ncbi:hypothetical protein [Azospirillum melinis]